MRNYHYLAIKNLRDFLGSPLVKHLACQCRENGFSPWCGKIPHPVGQLSLRATSTEAYEPWSLCSVRETTAMRSLDIEAKE